VFTVVNFLKLVVLKSFFFNCCFQDTDISQGNVSTHLRCGRIFSDLVITNVLLIQRVKQVWKSVNIWWS